jgi:hypothetical protein
MLCKYPKTMHLPWSPGLQNDDRLIESLDAFRGKRIIATEKMDGENASLYRDHYHARSLDSKHHPSRDWIKSFHAEVKFSIPENWRVCGENLFAEHSISYDDLPSYFMGFSIWNESNECLSWDDTVEWFELMNVVPVRVWWDGPFEEFLAHHEMLDARVQGNIEGYVIRVADSFAFPDFKTHVAKFVRKGHVQTDEHWMHKPVVPNGLKHS